MISTSLDLVLRAISCKNKPALLGTLIMTANGTERDLENKTRGQKMVGRTEPSSGNGLGVLLQRTRSLAEAHVAPPGV
jgi:hypothetical protein